MLGNLIENAIRFTPQGGRVTVAAYAADDGIVLEITDTGIGMSPERLAAVSQPFAFAFGDAALTREHGGAGLGISDRPRHRRAERRPPRDRQPPGLGTTVAISLPLRAAERGAAPPPRRSPLARAYHASAAALTSACISVTSSLSRSKLG